MSNPFEAVGERRIIAGRSIRWNADRAAAFYAEGQWTRLALGEALKIEAARDPDRILLVDGGVRISAKSLFRRASALASAFAAQYAPGSVISFMLPNWHEAAIIYFAASMAGMVIHPVLPSLRETELAFMLSELKSRMIFVPASYRGRDHATMVEAACARLENPPQIVVLRGDAGAHLAFEDLARGADGSRTGTVDPDAVHMILYTSGTTGTPKGVMHSQNSIHALIRQIERHWLVARGDIFLVPSPISHIGGSIYAFEAPLLLGCTAVLMDKWDAKDAIGLARTYPFTHLAGATPFLQQLLDAAREADETLPHLKLFVCGGAAVPERLIREAAAHFTNAVVTRVYGSTEVPVTTVGTIDSDDIDHASATDGRAGWADIRLATSPLASDSLEGEIFARGPQMLVGYTDLTAEDGLFDADGYYRTGDLGRWVDDSFLTISGRAKDIIIRNGENISPKEIEDILKDHPCIADVAIVGLPDPETGERACAVVVPRPETALLGAIGLDELVGFLRARGVASFKLPEQAETLGELPKNATGKVLKDVIRASILAETKA